VVPFEEAEAIDDLTVEVRMNQPWVAFPALLTAQAGVVPSPAQLDDPQDGPRNPVGTGPFVFDSWTSGDRFTATRNESYWREGLPHLDGVEFRVIPDADSRLQALQATNIHVMHTSDPESISRMIDESDNGDYQLLVSDGEGEESFVMLNLEAPPLDDLRVRQALAMATDRQEYIDLTAAGLPAPADSLFTSESKWYTSTDYPAFDPRAAAALVEEYEAEKGEIKFELATTNSTDNQRSITQLADMWAEVGIEATPKQVDQNTLIVDALGGRYQANLWRQFGAVEPDADAHWWMSDSTLNFANIADDEVDAAIDEGRTSADEATRKAAYAKLQRRFNELLPYIWLHHSVWGVGYGNDVHGITATFPDDPDHTIPMGGNFTAVHLLTEMWLDG
jgi:ABC-type transport system substrate-binding protein